MAPIIAQNMRPVCTRTEKDTLNLRLEGAIGRIGRKYKEYQFMFFSKFRPPFSDWIKMQSYELFVWGPWYLQQGVYALSNATFILPLLLSQNQQLPYTGFVIVKYTFCHTSRGREDNTGYFTFISERQIYTSTQLPLKLLLLLLLLSTETITSIQTIRDWDHKD